MPAVGFRRLFRHAVTIKRNTAATSASGVTPFNYAPIATGVRCLIQNGSGGKVVQLDAGQTSHRRYHALFGKEALNLGDEGSIQENDLCEVTSPLAGEVYRVAFVHYVPGTDHVEVDLEQYVPAGDA